MLLAIVFYSFIYFRKTISDTVTRACRSLACCSMLLEKQQANGEEAKESRRHRVKDIETNHDERTAGGCISCNSHKSNNKRSKSNSRASFNHLKPDSSSTAANITLEQLTHADIINHRLYLKHVASYENEHTINNTINSSMSQIDLTKNQNINEETIGGDGGCAAGDYNHPKRVKRLRKTNKKMENQANCQFYVSDTINKYQFMNKLNEKVRDVCLRNNRIRDIQPIPYSNSTINDQVYFSNSYESKK